MSRLDNSDYPGVRGFSDTPNNERNDTKLTILYTEIILWAVQ